MPTTCTKPAGETIVPGDAVCITGWDPGPPAQPIVKRATAANLATSKTVFGVAQSVVLNTATILVAGEVADNSLTALGAGNSRMIVTDHLNGTIASQCRLKRIDDTSGGVNRQEVYVVGTVDPNGTVAIQPRHNSDETGFPRVFNVRAYGATSYAN